ACSALADDAEDLAGADAESDVLEGRGLVDARTEPLGDAAELHDRGGGGHWEGSRALVGRGGPACRPDRARAALSVRDPIIVDGWVPGTGRKPSTPRAGTAPAGSSTACR